MLANLIRAVRDGARELVEVSVKPAAKVVKSKVAKRPV
jgi:hypothetical protein